VITTTHVENSRSLKRLFEGANDEFKERRNSNEHSADDVMCWIFSGTWSATECDVVEFNNSVVRCPHREPPLYFYKLSQA
jgi:hypothetical protein